MEDNGTEKWFVITSKPRSEQRAVDNLTSQHIEVYLPKIKRLKKRQGKKVIIEEVLFPNYLFIKLTIEKSNFNAIRSTRGVGSFVRFGLNYATINNELIAQLKTDLAESTEQNTVEILTNIDKGEQLIITEGPLQGLTGICQCKDGLERSVLLLNILGKENKVVIENNHFDVI